MRKTYTKEFKFKVALEALKGDLTLAEITSKYQVTPSLISKWKSMLLSDGSMVFSADKTKENSVISAQELEKLHAKIGKLTLENDFLAGAFKTSR